MDQTKVIEVMKSFFLNRNRPEVLDNFENTLAAQVLEESMDVVEFIIHLEDELHIKVDANEVGPAAAEMTFGELAAEVCRHIR